MDLFSDTYNEFDSLKVIPFPGGELMFMELFLDESQSSKLYELLKINIDWQSEAVFVYGKRHLVPRLTAWHGDKPYTYSGYTHPPKAWSKELLFLKKELKKVLPSFNPNGVLLNYYRNGRDKMGWHSDNEKELGFTPTIVSISLGETRRFDIKHRINKSQKLSLHLNSGSLLVMSGQSQANWLHQIPQQLKIEKGRINLTFRELI